MERKPDLVGFTFHVCAGRFAVFVLTGFAAKFRMASVLLCRLVLMVPPWHRTSMVGPKRRVLEQPVIKRGFGSFLSVSPHWPFARNVIKAASIPLLYMRREFLLHPGNIRRYKRIIKPLKTFVPPRNVIVQLGKWFRCVWSGPVGLSGRGEPDSRIINKRRNESNLLTVSCTGDIWNSTSSPLIKLRRTVITMNFEIIKTDRDHCQCF